MAVTGSPRSTDNHNQVYWDPLARGLRALSIGRPDLPALTKGGTRAPRLVLSLLRLDSCLAGSGSFPPPGLFSDRVLCPLAQ